MITVHVGRSAAGEERQVVNALTGLRVLDLSGPMGNYCGKLFADLGADVILVEPPCGNRLRREGPFIADVPDIERSLPFIYANTSKRGITLDFHRPEGAALLRRLAATADLLIETEKPGVMDSFGVGYEALAAVNPRIVVTSITPFGQTGPYAQYEAEDLIGLAMGGLLYLGGYPDTPPINTYGNQAFAAASMFGAVASMMALLNAERIGRGEHVDVSMQECVVMALETAAQFYDLEGVIKKRYGGLQRHAGTGVFPCKDGYIHFMAGGVGGDRFWKLTCEWLLEEGVEEARQFLEEKWLSHDYLGTDEAKEIFAKVFTPFAARYTMAELYEKGQRKHLPIAPLSTPADLLRNPQLKHRGFFVEMTHFLMDRTFVAPGAPYQLSETPWRIFRPAPRLGEHNAEVFEEIGVSPEELRVLMATRVL